MCFKETKKKFERERKSASKMKTVEHAINANASFWLALKVHTRKRDSRSRRVGILRNINSNSRNLSFDPNIMDNKIGLILKNSGWKQKAEDTANDETKKIVCLLLFIHIWPLSINGIIVS